MRYIATIITAFAVAGCSTDLTSEGAQVRQVSLSAATSCEFLGSVTASESMGMDVAGDVQSSFNKLSNEVAERGGNAFVLSTTNTSGFETVVRGDAYRC
jgi:hypothetical protein